MTEKDIKELTGLMAKVFAALDDTTPEDITNIRHKANINNKVKHTLGIEIMGATDDEKRYYSLVKWALEYGDKDCKQLVIMALLNLNHYNFDCVKVWAKAFKDSGCTMIDFLEELRHSYDEAIGRVHELAKRG